jgi:hypothetical protein
MNLKDRKFTDLITGSVITVNEQFENIAILDNDQRVDVGRLVDTKYYEEYIDPKTFFSNQKSYNVFAEKIMAIPNEVISKMEDTNDSAIIEVDPEDERREMERRAAEMGRNMNLGKSTQNQLDKLKEYMDEDIPVVSQQPRRQEPTQQYVQPQQSQQVVVNDPISDMFKNIKRNTDFNISINIENKIPRIDFIEMMEDSYEISIIDYLSEQFTNDLLKNPSRIKDIIKAEINTIVYGNPEGNTIIPEKEVKKSVVTKRAPKTKQSKV